MRIYVFIFLLGVLIPASRIWSQTDVERIAVKTDSVINAHFDGLGVEWDPFFWFPTNQSRGLSEDDWALIVQRIKLMQLQNVRMFILPNWYEPENDNQDADSIRQDGFLFDSAEMTAVYRYLDVCDSLNIDVNLTLWGARNDRLYGKPNYWLAFSGSNNWITAPNDLDEWAENVLALLRHLIEVRGYTCITYLTMSNEPNPPHQGFWTPGTINKKLWYREMYKRVDQRLRAEHLRDRIKLIGADEADTDDYSWFTYMAQGADSIMDVLASHTYAFDMDIPNYPDLIAAWVRRRIHTLANADRPAKPFFVAEFGTNNGIGPYQNPDVDTFERGFFLADFAIAAMNQGASLLSYWTLHDIWYQYGKLMQLGLWAYYDQQWRLRPSWYVWSMMSRLIRNGDKIIGTETSQPDRIAAVAVRNDDGRINIVVANRSEQPQAVQILFDDMSTRRFTKYVFAGETISALNDQLLPPVGTLFTQLTDTLLAKSITFYEEETSSGIFPSFETDAGPKTYSVLENYPNPFRSQTLIQLRLADFKRVTLAVYNLKGQLVRTLVRNSSVRNAHIVWDGCDDSGNKVAQGVYLLSLQGEGFFAGRKIVVF